MVWSVFSSSDVGELIRRDKHINSKENIYILVKGLLPTTDKLFFSANGVDIFST